MASKLYESKIQVKQFACRADRVKQSPEVPNTRESCGPADTIAATVLLVGTMNQTPNNNTYLQG